MLPRVELNKAKAKQGSKAEVRIGDWVRHINSSGNGYYYTNEKIQRRQVEKPGEWLEYEGTHGLVSTLACSTASSASFSHHNQQQQQTQQQSSASSSHHLLNQQQPLKLAMKTERLLNQQDNHQQRELYRRLWQHKQQMRGASNAGSSATFLRHLRPPPPLIPSFLSSSSHLQQQRGHNINPQQQISAPRQIISNNEQLATEPSGSLNDRRQYQSHHGGIQSNSTKTSISNTSTAAVKQQQGSYPKTQTSGRHFLSHVPAPTYNHRHTNIKTTGRGTFGLSIQPLSNMDSQDEEMSPMVISKPPKLVNAKEIKSTGISHHHQLQHNKSSSDLCIERNDTDMEIDDTHKKGNEDEDNQDQVNENDSRENEKEEEREGHGENNEETCKTSEVTSPDVTGSNIKAGQSGGAPKPTRPIILPTTEPLDQETLDKIPRAKLELLVDLGLIPVPPCLAEQFKPLVAPKTGGKKSATKAAETSSSTPIIENNDVIPKLALDSGSATQNVNMELDKLLIGKVSDKRKSLAKLGAIAPKPIAPKVARDALLTKKMFGLTLPTLPILKPKPPIGPRQIGSSPAASQPKQAQGEEDGKASHLKCEICDEQLTDLEHLRIHMEFSHRVKIDPLIINGLPPLYCTKCQHRFFSDQGLEKHLFATHKVATPIMEQLAKKEQAGPVSTTSKDRRDNVTWTAGELRYQCQGCDAILDTYQNFQDHVYSTHYKDSKDNSSVTEGKDEEKGEEEKEGEGEEEVNESKEKKGDDEVQVIEIDESPPKPPATVVRVHKQSEPRKKRDLKKRRLSISNLILPKDIEITECVADSDTD